MIKRDMAMAFSLYNWSFFLNKPYTRESLPELHAEYDALQERAKLFSDQALLTTNSRKIQALERKAFKLSERAGKVAQCIKEVEEAGDSWSESSEWWTWLV
jgi:hypothetical protein